MRTRRFRMLSLVVLLATVVFMTAAQAALPPGSYEKLKAQAQEKLRVKITEVEQQGTGSKLQVNFTAEVLQVERSATGLKPGDQITIQSYHWTKSYAGPKNPPVLPKGWVGVAYLNKAKGSNKNYALAAYGESFEPGR